jgi:hypothetical protein
MIVVVVKVVDGSVMVRGIVVATWTNGIGMRRSGRFGGMTVVNAVTTGIVTGEASAIVVTNGTATVGVTTTGMLTVGGGGRMVVVAGPNK